MLPNLSMCMSVCLSQISIYHIISTTWKLAHVHIHTQRQETERATHLPALEMVLCLCVVILHWFCSWSRDLLWPMKNHWETNLFWEKSFSMGLLECFGDHDVKKYSPAYLEDTWSKIWPSQLEPRFQSTD